MFHNHCLLARRILGVSISCLPCGVASQCHFSWELFLLMTGHITYYITVHLISKDILMTPLHKDEKSSSVILLAPECVSLLCVYMSNPTSVCTSQDNWHTSLTRNFAGTLLHFSMILWWENSCSIHWRKQSTVTVFICILAPTAHWSIWLSILEVWKTDLNKAQGCYLVVLLFSKEVMINASGCTKGRNVTDKYILKDLLTLCPLCFSLEMNLSKQHVKIK